MTKSRIMVALLVTSLVGVGGVGLCCAPMAAVEGPAHGCCPPEAGFAEARLLCCESPSAARTVSQDVNLAAPQALVVHPVDSSPAPGVLPAAMLVHVSPAPPPQPPASSPILRI